MTRPFLNMRSKCRRNPLGGLETTRDGGNIDIVLGGDVSGPDTGCCLSVGSDVKVFIITGDDVKGEMVTGILSSVDGGGVVVAGADVRAVKGDDVRAARPDGAEVAGADIAFGEAENGLKKGGVMGAEVMVGENPGADEKGAGPS